MLGILESIGCPRPDGGAVCAHHGRSVFAPVVLPSFRVHRIVIRRSRRCVEGVAGSDFPSVDLDLLKVGTL